MIIFWVVTHQLFNFYPARPETKKIIVYEENDDLSHNNQWKHHGLRIFSAKIGLQLPGCCAAVPRHAVPLQAPGLWKRRGVATGVHHSRSGPGGSGEDRHLCAALCAIYHWMPGIFQGKSWETVGKWIESMAERYPEIVFFWDSHDLDHEFWMPWVWTIQVLAMSGPRWVSRGVNPFRPKWERLTRNKWDERECNISQLGLEGIAGALAGILEFAK